jgi:uncharacterized protein
MNEGRTVVAEDPALSDRALYWAVVGAVADGATTRGEITAALGRAPTSLHHALAALIEANWLVANNDPLRERSSRYVLGEPIVRFHRLVVEPAAPRLTRRGAAKSVWEDAVVLVRSRIYGSHLEQLAREWVLLDSAESTTGGAVNACGPSRVGSGARTIQLDLLATSANARGQQRVCAIGEVKSGQDRVGADQLARLDQAVQELDPDLFTDTPRKLLVSRSGFTRDLEQTAAKRHDVELIDMVRLYSGT